MKTEEEVDVDIEAVKAEINRLNGEIRKINKDRVVSPLVFGLPWIVFGILAMMTMDPLTFMIGAFIFIPMGFLYIAVLARAPPELKAYKERKSLLLKTMENSGLRVKLDEKGYVASIRRTRRKVISSSAST